MSVGVIDAGIPIGWMRGGHRSQKALDALFQGCRSGRLTLHLSTVNLAEVLLHTEELAKASGVDTVAFLKAAGVRLQAPDEAIARRTARLCSAYDTALADGFAAATAMELGVRLHTTDRPLVELLRRARISVTYY